MGLLVERKTERIELGNGEWLEILVTLPFKEAVQAQALVRKPNKEGIIELVKLLIVAWSSELPLTPENLDLLSAEAGTEVLGRIPQITVGADPKVSLSPSTSTSRANRKRHTKKS